ncbi:transmembrane gamma-carboxyglutamic acid protein 2 isoform X2 [Tamandua tetradactyla]|uniref:transmembrane gamma-carboxyglutamic acid protein 2 isoform X2 n=1 Tax=Tamandua tetradactyla TaxID=48850 RepID=UPI00405402C6
MAKEGATEARTFPRRAWACGCGRPGGGADLGHPPHCPGRPGSLLVSAVAAGPQSAAILSPGGRAHQSAEPPDLPGPTDAPAPTPTPTSRSSHLRAGAGGLWGARRTSAPLHQPPEASLKCSFGARVPHAVPLIHTGFRKPPGPLDSGAVLGEGWVGVGVVRSEAYPGTRVSAVYGSAHGLGQRVHMFRPFARPPRSPDPGDRPAPPQGRRARVGTGTLAHSPGLRPARASRCGRSPVSRAT